MSNTPISREDVHTYAALRHGNGFSIHRIEIVKITRQTRLYEANFKDIDPLAGQVALYMLSVAYVYLNKTAVE